MGSKLFYPYATMDNEISFDISPTGPGLFTASDGSVEISDPDIDTVNFTAAAVVDSSIFRKVLHESELPDREEVLRLVLICKSRESRVTEVFEFGHGDDNSGTLRFGIEMVLDRELWKGEASLHAVLCRVTSNDTLPPEYGQQKGCKLAWSEERSIFFVPRDRHSGTDIDVQWAEFGESEDLQIYSKQMFHLDLDPMRIRPVLYLNRDIGERFEELLESTFSPGDSLRDQRTVEAVIQSQVYGLLFTAALESYRTAAKIYVGAQDPSEVFEEPPVLRLRGSDGAWRDSWKKDILIRHAAQLCPGESDPEEYIESSINQMNDDTEFVRLMGNVGDVAQKISGISEAMRVRFVQYAAEDTSDLED